MADDGVQLDAVARRFPDDDARWDAVSRRAAEADGQFVYAVKSTGVYCRPTCPSRRPKRENVTFFDTGEAAAAAGFRPCLRCQPDDVSTQAQVVAHVRQLLDTHEPAPALAELGAAVGMSPYHLQRLFKKATGMSPREYAAARRAERLKAELRQGATVTGALYDAGYGSTRALYDQAHKQLGMSPGVYRRGGQGVTIRYTLFDTPLGRMLLAATDKGLCALRFGTDDVLLAELRLEFPQATIVDDCVALDSYARAVRAYLSGQERLLTLPLDVQATAFQQRVWGALQDIPYGETRSYQQVAQSIGKPKAVRAVARACATNPVALVVPCHRVVRAGGELSGYRWGVERKRQLLDQEQST